MTEKLTVADVLARLPENVIVQGAARLADANTLRAYRALQRLHRPYEAAWRDAVRSGRERLGE